MKKVFLIALIGLMTIAFTSCDKDEKPSASSEVITTFNTMFPQAKLVEWDREGGYWIAEFRNGGKETEAWFETSGVWHETKTDILRADLPSVVETAFASGEYKDWRMDDLDRIERRETTTYFVFELEKLSQERTVRYDIEGNLLP